MSTHAYTRDTGRPRRPRTALVIEVFVAGATGVICTEVVSQPAAAGHDMIGVTRSPAKTDMLRALGARPVVADALDRDAVARAVAETSRSDCPPAHRAQGRAGPEAPRPLRRHDQPPAHRGHRPPAGRRPGRRHSPLHRSRASNHRQPTPAHHPPTGGTGHASRRSGRAVRSPPRGLPPSRRARQAGGGTARARCGPS